MFLKRFTGLIAAIWMAMPAVPVPAASPTPRPAPSGAVNAAAMQTGTAAPTPAPPVPLLDAVAQAEKMSQWLQEMQTRAGNAGAGVTDGLPGITKQIDDLSMETQQALTPGAPLDVVKNIGAKWDAISAQTEGWTQGLKTTGTQVNNDIQDLRAQRETWDSTQKLAENPASPAPPEVTQRIKDINDAIKKTDGVLQKARTTVLTLQSRVAAQAQRVAAGQQSVSAAETAAVATLWNQDSPPVWSGALWAGAGRDAVARSHATLGQQEAQAGTFLAAQWSKLVYFALVLCALAFALSHARWRLRKIGEEWKNEDAALERADRIIQSPFVTAWVLAFLCSPLIFTGAPRLFHVALTVIALAPIVVLLRRLIDRHLFPVLYASVVFYLLGLLSVLTAVPVLSRGILLAQTLSGAVFALWFLRSKRDTYHGTTSRKIARAAMRLGVALLGFVFIANALGYAGLANYLGTGILGAAYWAIVLYAATNILKGIAFLALQLWPLDSLRMVRQHRPLLRGRIGKIISLSALVFWFLRTLDLFSLRKPVLDWVWWALSNKQKMGSLEVSAGDVLGFILTVWASVMVARFIRFVLEEEVFDRTHMARGSSYAITTLLRYVVLLVGVIIALGVLGVGMDKLTILVSAFGVGIGFGLQNIFNNFFSGIILLLERPVRVGDVIDVGGASGVVMQIGIRASKLRLGDNSVLIVPNGQLISDKVTNRDVPGRQAQIDLLVRVSLKSDPQRVIEVLLAVAAAHKLVSGKPIPEVFLKEYGLEALLFDLMCFTDDPAHAVRVQSELAVAAYAAMREAGIELPSTRPG